MEGTSQSVDRWRNEVPIAAETGGIETPALATFYMRRK